MLSSPLRKTDIFHLCKTSLNVYRNSNYTCQLQSEREKKTQHYEIFKYFSELFQKTGLDI